MPNNTWQVRDKYDREHFIKVTVKLDKAIVEQWRQALAEDGASQAGFIRDAILKYLDERKGAQK